jgi:ketosteroid isomerase-like protein
MSGDAVDVVHRWYAAFAAQDMEAVEDLLDPEISFHVPGSNQFAGEYRGRSDLMALFAQVKAYTNGTFRIRVHDIVGGVESASVLVEAFAERDGRRVAEKDVEVHRVRDGRIVDITLFIDDVYGGDEFWGS